MLWRWIPRVNPRFVFLNFILIFAVISSDPRVLAQDKLNLVHATICEEIKESAPQRSAVAFSINLGRVSCFTSYDPVPEKTVVNYNWFFKDSLNKTVKLGLKPPRWSTFSSIQLRETDKGPWRVEITNERGETLRVLRFSIVD